MSELNSQISHKKHIPFCVLGLLNSLNSDLVRTPFCLGTKLGVGGGALGKPALLVHW
jgi:hypothetical protein